MFALAAYMSRPYPLVRADGLGCLWPLCTAVMAS